MRLGKRGILIALLLAFSLGLNVGLLVKAPPRLHVQAQPSTGGPSFESLNVEKDLTVGGKVGIGTANPSAKLHVAGDFIRADGAGNEQAYIGGDGIIGPLGLDVNLGSFNPEVQAISLYNPGGNFTMDLHARNALLEGNLTVHGTKNFVQDHPIDPTREIVYVSLEGPEAGTYIRGTAQLTNGEAVIWLPEHFSMVTAEEGLTVQVTPWEDCNGLYVAERSTSRIVVRELRGGKSNTKFDYLVHGVRKGYESYQVIREKQN